MATKTFGLGKTYDWSSTYWSTLTNVQDTNITTATGADGWKVLAFVSAAITKNFGVDGNFTGWTEGSAGSCDSLIDGNLKQYAVAGGYTIVDSPNMSAGIKANITAYKLAKITTFTSPSTSNIWSGSEVSLPNRGKIAWSYIGKDATSTYFSGIIQKGATGATAKSADTTVAIDNRYHLHGLYRPDNDNQYTLVFDGKELITDGGCATDSGDRMSIGQRTGAGETGVVGTSYCQVSWLWYTKTPWQTSDGILESDATSAVFDAGVGEQHKKLEWTADTSNGTAIVVEARCAATSGGLSSASYETLTSGIDITTKGRYIQIKITLQDASSGQYTPILKDMTLTTETAPATGTSRARFRLRRKR